MSTRFVQAFVLASFCFIPSTALADGLLESVSDQVSSTVKDTVNIQHKDESTDESEKEQNVDLEKRETLLGTVTENVEKTIDSVADTVINVNTDKHNEAENDAVLNVNLSEDPSIKVDAVIAEANVSDSISIKTPVAEAEAGDSIKVETPAADVKVSDSISVKTGIVDADIGDTVEVKTPVANVNVSDSISVTTGLADANIGDSIEVETPIADINLSDSISVSTPATEADHHDANRAENKDWHSNTSNEQQEEKTPAAGSKGKDQSGKSVAKDALEPNGELNDSKIKSDNKKAIFTDLKNSYDPIHLEEQSKYTSKKDNMGEDVSKKQESVEPVLQRAIATVPVNHGTNSSITTSANGGHSSIGGAAFPSINFVDSAMLGDLGGKLKRNGSVAFFHDQWLNAPPSQPPQSSFFSYVFI